MITALLIIHGLVAVALLGAITHQTGSLFLRRRLAPTLFVGSYVAVRQERFTRAVIVLYVLVVVLGALIYPSYRVDVRIPFEEMGLNWAVGLFEVKEHGGAIGLGTLPLYGWLWRPQFAVTHMRDRRAITVILFVIVWFDFLTGHVLNDIRGLN